MYIAIEDNEPIAVSNSLISLYKQCNDYMGDEFVGKVEFSYKYGGDTLIEKLTYPIGETIRIFELNYYD